MYSGPRASDPSIQRIVSAGPAHAVVLDHRSPRATLMGLPPGPAGTVATVKLMKRLAKEAIRSPTQAVRAQALEIFRANNLQARQWIPEIAALQRWVQKNITYTRDPVEVELVQTPEVTLKLRRGDCDDQATLLGAMLEATGHPARLVAVGVGGGPFSHVYVETKAAKGWLGAETIHPKPLGWKPPDATSRYELNLS